MSLVMWFDTLIMVIFSILRSLLLVLHFLLF